MIDITNKQKLTVATEPKAVIQGNLEICGYGTLPVEIIGDFTNVPKQRHELFMMLMLQLYAPPKRSGVEINPSKETKPSKDDRSFLRRLFDSITFNTKEK